MKTSAFLTIAFLAFLTIGGAASAADHTVTSASQMDAAFWSGLADGDAVTLSGDFALSAQPVLTGKSVTFTSDNGSARILAVGSQRLVWANVTTGPVNTVTLDGVTLAGGTGNSVGGALRANLGYSLVASQIRPELKIVFKNGSEVSGNMVTGLNEVFDSADMMEGMLAPHFQALGGGFMVHSASMEGDSVTFRNNKAVAIGQDDPAAFLGTLFAGAGGGVMAMNVLKIDADHILFSGNQARDESDDGFYEGGSGGGLWASYPTLTAKTITFENNLAYTKHGGSDGAVDEGGLGGGFYAGQMNMTADAIIFRNNRAEGEGDHTGYGGAMYGTQTINIHGNALLEGNQAIGKAYSSGKGGAIYNNGVLTMTGSALFKNNTARGDGGHSGLGGGIISREFSIENASFIGNQAIGDGDAATYSGLGGGIYFHTQGYKHTGRPDDTANIGTIIATSGHETIFQGNTDGSAAVRRANGLFMGTYETAANPSAIMGLQTGILNLRAQGDGLISFHDPLASDKRAHQININPESGDTGVVHFWGDNEYYGSTNVHRGTFSLMTNEGLGDTVYGRKGEGLASAFLLKSGATLGVDVKSRLLADSVTVENGAELEVYGISRLAAGSTVVSGIIQTDAGLNIPTLYTSGGLYSARLVANSLNGDLAVNVTDLTQAWGRPFQALDIFRVSALPGTDQRAWLDSIYEDALSREAALTTARALNGSDVVSGRETMAWAGLNLGRSVADHLRRVADELNTDHAPAAGYDAEANGLWLRFSQHYISRDAYDASSGYSFKPYAVTLGYDRNVGDWLIGLAGQYAGGRLKADDGSSETKLDSFVGALYAAYGSGPWYADLGLSFGFGQNDLSTRYQAWGQSSIGSYDSRLIGANAEAGYQFKFGDESPLKLTPHMGVNYVHLRADAFDELSGNGAPRRHFGQATADFFEIPIGLSLEKEIAVGPNFRLSPNLDLNYVAKLGDKRLENRVGFIGPVGDTWLAEGVDNGRNAFRVKAGLEGMISERVKMELSYQGEFSRNYRDNAASAALSFTF